MKDRNGRPLFPGLLLRYETHPSWVARIVDIILDSYNREVILLSASSFTGRAPGCHARFTESELQDTRWALPP